MAKPETKGTIEANQAQLYYEKRGSGPALLFIAGASGDAEDFAGVAELLADAFTVVTYDRRGFSRSPWPSGKTATSVDEQADDAAALLARLKLVPAAVYGNSSGAIIALSLVLRHPEVVTKAMLHEPPLMAGLTDPSQGMAGLRRVVADGKLEGQMRGGMEAFIRAGAGDANYEALSNDHRERLLSNGSIFLTHEFDRYEWYRPADADLASIQRAVMVLAGTTSAPFFRPVAEWLAQRLGTEAIPLAGGHTPQRDQPREVAEIVRRFVAPGSAICCS
jgi:pimeloyl-ACP methyl ester carboxylesterase